MFTNLIILRGVVQHNYRNKDLQFNKRNNVVHGNILVTHKKTFQYFVRAHMLRSLVDLPLYIDFVLRLVFEGARVSAKHVRVINFHANGNIQFKRTGLLNSFIPPIESKYIIRAVHVAIESPAIYEPTTLGRIRRSQNFIALKIKFDFGTLKFQPNRANNQVQITLIGNRIDAEVLSLVDYIDQHGG